MKRIIKSAVLASAVISCLFCSAGTVSAASVGDVIAHAYEVGMPEEMIQNYISMGSGRDWTSEQCDQAIATLDEWYGQRDDAIGNGSSGNTYIPDPITPDEFSKLPVEDKKDYITNISPDKKQDYLDVMTNDEKNTLLKELDATQQIEVISGMLGFGDAFGYNFSIEDVADGSVMISARDENNKLIGVTVLGDSIEKTGISYTVPILTAAALILLSAAGMVIAVRKCREEK